MSNLMLDVDQAGELKAAFRRGDWSNAQIKQLCEGDVLRRVRGVLLGLSEIKPILHAIDCESTPFIDADWSVHEEDQIPNRVRGIFTWDPTKVKLYLSKKQRGDKYLIGTDLRKELKSQPVLNANVLDYLLKPEHQHLIPEEWKGRRIFFWGTIYRSSCGSLYVRCLCWLSSGWDWDFYGMGIGGFSGNYLALVSPR